MQTATTKVNQLKYTLACFMCYVDDEEGLSDVRDWVRATS